MSIHLTFAAVDWNLFCCIASCRCYTSTITCPQPKYWHTGTVIDWLQFFSLSLSLSLSLSYVSMIALTAYEMNLYWLYHLETKIKASSSNAGSWHAAWRDLWFYCWYYCICVSNWCFSNQYINLFWVFVLLGSQPFLYMVGKTILGFSNPQLWCNRAPSQKGGGRGGGEREWERCCRWCRHAFAIVYKLQCL